MSADGFGIVEWLSSDAADELGANLEEGFINVGFPAEANIAAVVVHETKDKGLKHQITGHFSSIFQFSEDSMVPTEYRNSWTSRTDNEPKDPVLAQMQKKLGKQLGIDYHSPIFSSFNAAEAAWKRLPRTYVQAGEDDLLRDDAVIYAEALRKLSAEVECHARAMSKSRYIDDRSLLVRTTGMRCQCC